MNEIYLDYAAATPVHPEVLDAMLPYFTKIYGNAESEHIQGRKAREAVDRARHSAAHILNCRPDEIIFTSGGTESNNLAIRGVARAHVSPLTIITTNIEHDSILKPVEQLAKEGNMTNILEVEKNGILDPQKLSAKFEKIKSTAFEKKQKSANPQNTENFAVLTSIIYVNNEIGTIQPIVECGVICRKYGAIFHTDACQAANYLTLDTKKLGSDLLTLSGSKIYGPKGIGLLFIKKNSAKISQNKTPVAPIIVGGNQEFGIRGGTINTPLIIGFIKALEIVQSQKDAEKKRLYEIQKHLIEEIMRYFPHARINGDLDRAKRIPNNVNISFKNISGKELVFQLSEQNICLSTGSACGSRKTAPSHVLTAIGLSVREANSSLRFSLGMPTTKAEIATTISVLKSLIN